MTQQANPISRYNKPGKERVPQPAGTQVANWYEEEQPIPAQMLHVIAHLKGERDELLEALQYCINEVNNSNDLYVLPRIALDKATAALTKATGGQS